MKSLASRAEGAARWTIGRAKSHLDLQIGLAVVDLFLPWCGQEKYNARQVNRARKLYAEVDRIVDVITIELGSMVDEVIRDVLDESIAPLRANLAALTEQADATTRQRTGPVERHLAGLQIGQPVCGTSLKREHSAIESPTQVTVTLL